MSTPHPKPTTDREVPRWRDATLADATRVDDLLAGMTIEEKVSQLGSRWVGNDIRAAGAGDTPCNVAPMQHVFAASGAPPLEESSRHRTAFTGVDLREVVEPGDLEVLVGTSAADLPCRGRVRLTGPLRVVGHDRRLVTPVDLSPAPGRYIVHREVLA